MTPKSDWGRALSGVLEPGPSRATLASQRRSVLAAMRDATRPRPRWPYTLTAAAAACALALTAVFTWLPRPPGELTAALDGRKLAPRAVVTGSRARVDVVRFSDGSRVDVAAGAELTVSRLAPTAVELSLRDGLLHAQVAKATGRTWSVLAGPYRVQVVGTDFSVKWDSSAQEIEVNVIEGRVLVFGLELPAGGLALPAGARFNRRANLELSGLAERLPDQPVASSTSSAAPERQGLPHPSGSGSATRVLDSRAADAPDWRELAAGQRYGEALAAARGVGLERLLSALNDTDLLLLANTARYAGAVPDAQRALLALRARFPKSPSATVAALVLAGIQERAKNPSEAARWLRTFLAESPNGELSAGARARLLGILVRSGQRSEARRVAADYLRLHPRGPYVTEARGVLDSGSLP